MDSDIKRLFGREPEELVIEIEIERLRDFKNHPFRIRDDLQMRSLKESIQKYGILTPLIVRPVIEGYYEIISGHRRRFIAKMLGFRKVPVIIRILKDDEAVIAMVDAVRP
jgi:ParB family chromosome partitioning protein